MFRDSKVRKSKYNFLYVLLQTAKYLRSEKFEPETFRLVSQSCNHSANAP